MDTLPPPPAPPPPLRVCVGELLWEDVTTNDPVMVPLSEVTGDAVWREVRVPLHLGDPVGVLVTRVGEGTTLRVLPVEADAGTSVKERVLVGVFWSLKEGEGEMVSV